MPEPEDPLITPTPPAGASGAFSDSGELTDSRMENMLDAGISDSSPSPRRVRDWMPPRTEELQRMLPQYEIKAFIARGGMGAVYRGVQRSLDRTVAIKILPPGIEDGECNYAERFKQEAKAMAMFKHSGIVAVYDAGETPEGLLYFVMEFIEGTDVAHLVSTKGRLSPEQALTITATVCDALAYAHARGVIHRDIKPSNVMIGSDGSVKVADFGLAKVSTPDGTSMTRSNLAMGSPDFVAPEALNAGIPVDQRADLYALGVMLYQMLTGKIPRGRFALPSGMLPQLDPRFDSVIDRAMQTDREQRYASAEQMRSDLDPIITGPLNQAAASTDDELKPAAQVSEPTPVRRWLALGFGSVCVLLIGGASLLKQSPETPAKTELETVQQAHQAVSQQLPTPESTSIKHSPSSTATSQGEVFWVDLLHTPGKLSLEGDAAILPDGLRLNPNARAMVTNDQTPRGDSIRMTLVHDPSMQAVSLLGRGRYALTVDKREVIFENRTEGRLKRLSVHQLPPSLIPGQEYQVELWVVGSMVCAKLNGAILSRVKLADVDTTVGSTGIRCGNSSVAKAAMVRKLEYLSLDGMSEDEAFKLISGPILRSEQLAGLGRAASPQTQAMPQGSVFTNTLGMQFVPVPITGGPTNGKRVLFSIWETRVQDFNLFIQETHASWLNPPFEQKPTHPAVNMNWDTAQDFCHWLTNRERKAGKLGADVRYRLPTDHEWSCAAGIGDREDPEKTPSQKKERYLDLFVWGTTWPPKSGAGNFSGEEVEGHKLYPNQAILLGYNDGFPETSPVGSFAPNRYGLFDLAGNVAEWCEDVFSSSDTRRTMRSSSFTSCARGTLNVTSRNSDTSLNCSPTRGFRIVLGPDLPNASAAKPIPVVSSPNETVLRWGGHRYQFVVSTCSWTEARLKAEEMGGHLATITSPDEQAWFLENIRPRSTHIWLGGKKQPDGSWAWTTGEPWEFTFWAKQQPGSILPPIPDKSNPTRPAVLEFGIYPWFIPPGGWHDAGDHTRPLEATRDAGFLVEWDSAS